MLTEIFSSALAWAGLSHRSLCLGLVLRRQQSGAASCLAAAASHLLVKYYSLLALASDASLLFSSGSRGAAEGGQVTT